MIEYYIGLGKTNQMEIRGKNIMSEAEKKFLNVKGLKKSFGSGDTKQDVLKGLDFTVG